MDLNLLLSTRVLRKPCSIRQKASSTDAQFSLDAIFDIIDERAHSIGPRLRVAPSANTKRAPFRTPASLNLKMPFIASSSTRRPRNTDGSTPARSSRDTDTEPARHSSRGRADRASGRPDKALRQPRRFLRVNWIHRHRCCQVEGYQRLGRNPGPRSGSGRRSRRPHRAAGRRANRRAAAAAGRAANHRAHHRAADNVLYRASGLAGTLHLELVRLQRITLPAQIKRGQLQGQLRAASSVPEPTFFESAITPCTVAPRGIARTPP